MDQFHLYTSIKTLNFTRALVCWQIAHKYLVEKHLSPADETQFKEQLYRIWFELYARRGSSRWVDSEQQLNITSLMRSGTIPALVASVWDGLCQKRMDNWSRCVDRCYCVFLQARFFRVWACVCRRDERTTDRDWISQLDPAVPAGEAGAHRLQRLQCYCKFTPGVISHFKWMKQKENILVYAVNRWTGSQIACYLRFNCILCTMIKNCLAKEAKMKWCFCLLSLATSHVLSHASLMRTNTFWRYSSAGRTA